MATPPPVAQPQKKGGGGLGIVLALLGLLVLLVGGGVFAYTQGYIGGGKTASTGPSSTEKVASTAPTVTPDTTMTANPTTSESGNLEPLALGSAKNTQSLVAPAVKKDAGAAPVVGATQPTATQAQPTYTTTAPPTYTTTYTNPPPPQTNPNEPAVCRSARQANLAGARRQAADLARRCIAQGGSPPFLKFSEAERQAFAGLPHATLLRLAKSRSSRWRES